VTRPPSPKRTPTSTSTSTNNISNKRSASASKSPASTTTTISTMATKKKRLTMTNNVQPISPTIRHTSTVETTAGQNKRTSSVDDMIFFEKVKFEFLKYFVNRLI
jgi:hypothetical protein